MDAPSPLPQQQPQPTNIRCDQNIPMPQTMRHSISHSTDDLSPLTQRSTLNIPLPKVKGLYMNPMGAFSKSLSNPMVDLYQKPEMPQIPEIPQIPQMYHGRSGMGMGMSSKQNKHLAWQQPLSGSNSAFNPFSSNNSYTAYNSSSASAYQSNYSR